MSDAPVAHPVAETPAAVLQRPVAKGFWADAWGRVLRRPMAVVGLTWISIVAFFAIFAPLVANGHPLLWRELSADGSVTGTSSPLLRHLSTVDILLIVGAILGGLWLLLPLKRFGRAALPRGLRIAALLVAGFQAGVTTIVMALLAARPEVDRMISGPDATALRTLALWWAVAVVVSIPFVLLAPLERWRGRMAIGLVVAALCTAAQWWGGVTRLTNFERYGEQEAAGQATAIYTLIPWSPTQSRTDAYLLPPMTRLGEHAVDKAGTPMGDRVYILGTDLVGRDVLTQLLYGCRLSISIGLVSTGIAVVIGVTLGALMGYFGGWVDLLLYRVVEVFMAIPVLFLLIVAAAVLPRNTYVMMAIIGCVTWTGAARFTRAEFLKLRSQEFVQGAQALGLPTRSILFRHMLPNGVTPVLVDASFAIAAAILAEATLSYLGLGPDGQASWGRLLSSANTSIGDFVWWLAIFPGLAIFLTVLAYNLLGESLRDAIDPKLRKAAH